MKRSIFKFSVFLIAAFIVIFFILNLAIYLIFHTDSLVTSEVISYYEKMFFFSSVYVVIIHLFSLALTIVFVVKRKPTLWWSFLIVAAFSAFTFLFLMKYLNILLYKMVLFLDCL